LTSRTTTAAALVRRASTLSLSAWIFIGLGLGILVGLFFGERPSSSRWPGSTSG
jgi:Na+/H+-dicarboxylate symporter